MTWPLSTKTPLLWSVETSTKTWQEAGESNTNSFNFALRLFENDFYFCACFACMYVCTPVVCLNYQKPEEDGRLPEIWATDGCQLPWVLGAELQPSARVASSLKGQVISTHTLLLKKKRNKKPHEEFMYLPFQINKDLLQTFYFRKEMKHYRAEVPMPPALLLFFFIFRASTVDSMCFRSYLHMFTTHMSVGDV